MDTELQVCNDDPLRAFCEACILREGQKWPVSELELASAFVKFFNVPPLAHVGSLEGFFVQTRIELRKGDLPSDLLGVNMSFQGRRRIDLSGHGEQQHSQLHTVLHEIREIIENEFSRLGFDTTDSRELEASADEFAFYAVLCPFEGLFRDSLGNALEIESKWQRWTALSLICSVALVLCCCSLMGAFFPQITVTQSGVQFEG
jgi:hypothetical protein